MNEGTIQNTKPAKGFGFLKTTSGQELFFHQTSVDHGRFEELVEGQVVNYVVGRDPQGFFAERVRIIGS